MHESSIQALVHVARVSGSRLRELSDQLETAEPRFVEGTLRSLAKEADALSAALARLAKHSDALPDETPKTSQNEPPVDDAGLLDLARRIKMAATFGICDFCGGVRSDGGGYGRIEAASALVVEHVKAAIRQQAAQNET